VHISDDIGEEAWIYGMYICRAENELGKVHMMVELVQSTVPEAPLPIVLLHVFPDRVDINVTPVVNIGGVEVNKHKPAIYINFHYSFLLA